QGAFGRALAEIGSSLERNEVNGVRSLLTDLSGHSDLGRHLTKPWRVVLAGAPNVGKSSLANCLAGYLRSVVAPTPGTTRDIVTTNLAIDGWPIELSDTAGIREADDTLEGQGVALARSAVAQAEVCLWLLYAGAQPFSPDTESTKLHLVINKMDVPPTGDLRQAERALKVSAKTADGLEELGNAISHWLAPSPPSPGSAVPFTRKISD